MAHKLINTPDEIPTVYQKTFAYLSGEVFWLWEKWNQYDKLFGFSQERVRLLEEGGRFFSLLLHDLLLDDTILGLCRLFDPAESYVRHKNKKVPNLSFPYLKSLVERTGNSEFAGKLEEQLALLEIKVNALRVHRNERISHLDHSAATSEHQNWPAVSRNLIAEVLQGAETLLKEFEEHFTKRHIDSRFAPSPGGWEALLTALAKARAYDHLENEGKIPPNTFRNFTLGVE